MKLELDHLLICTPVGTPEVDELVAFGLTEGIRNKHPGQGTTNRRIFSTRPVEPLRFGIPFGAGSSPGCCRYLPAANFGSFRCGETEEEIYDRH